MPIQFIRVERESHRYLETNQVTRESPVSLTVNGEIWLTFMCIPIDLPALAVGFLFNEGKIESLEEIANLRLCPAQDNVDIWTHTQLSKPAHWRRTSGCTGGSTSIEKDQTVFHPKASEYTNGNRLPTGKIYHLIDELMKGQELYRQTGGVHTSALTDGAGSIIFAEDIGRHNTLDKLAGRTLIEKIHLNRKFLLTTGRISSEMMQKSARIGAEVVISRTSPSTLSIQMAEQSGITLIGYARRDGFTIYTHPERINLEEIRKTERLDTLSKNG